MEVRTPLNLLQNELSQLVIENAGLDPSSPADGRIYFNTSSNKLRYWNGSSWVDLESKFAGTFAALSDVSITSASKDDTIHYDGSSWVNIPSDTVNAKNYGATGDGVTDDTTSIQNAINASVGKSLFIPSGTYVVSSAISIPSNSTIRMASDAILDYSGVSQAAGANLKRVIEIFGSVSSTVNLTSDVSLGDTTITVSSTAGYSVGDTVEVEGTEPLHANYSNRFKGYVAKVIDVTSGTVLTLDTKAPFNIDATTTYSATARYITPKHSIVIEGGKLLGGGDLYGHTGVYVLRAENILIKNVTIEDFETVGIQFNSTYNARIENCNILNCTSPNEIGHGNYGYGVGLGSATTRINIVGNHFTKCRHAVAGGGAIPSMNVLVKNNHSVNGGLGASDFDCHESCINWVFDSNTIIGGPDGSGGIVVRGTNVVVSNNIIDSGKIQLANTESITGSTLGRVSVIGNHIKNSTNAISFTGSNLQNYTIRGGVIENCGSAIISSNIVNNVTISGINFIDCSIPIDIILEDSIISDCTITGATIGIDFSSTSNNISISNCYIEATTSYIRAYNSSGITISNVRGAGGTTLSHGFFFNRTPNARISNCIIEVNNTSYNGINAWGGDGAVDIENFSIIGCRVHGAFGYGARIYGNSDNVVIVGNDFEGASISRYTTDATNFKTESNIGDAASGAGDVSKVGTPADDQVAVWTGNGTVEGTSDLTFDGSVLATTGEIRGDTINIQNGGSAALDARFAGYIGPEKTTTGVSASRGFGFFPVIEGDTTTIGGFEIQSRIKPSAAGLVGSYGTINVTLIDEDSSNTSHDLGTFHGNYQRTDLTAAYSGNVGNNNSFHIANPIINGGSGSITNNYALYIGTQNAGTSLNKAIFIQGDNDIDTGGDLVMRGSASGYVKITAPAVAGASIITWPATTGTVALESQIIDTISGLSDTTINSPAPAQMLVYDSDWKNVSMSGDGSLASDGTFTLANSGVSAGTAGGVSVIPVLTIDAKGRVTNYSAASYVAYTQITADGGSSLNASSNATVKIAGGSGTSTSATFSGTRVLTINVDISKQATQTPDTSEDLLLYEDATDGGIHSVVFEDIGPTFALSGYSHLILPDSSSDRLLIWDNDVSTYKYTTAGGIVGSYITTTQDVYRDPSDSKLHIQPKAQVNGSSNITISPSNDNFSFYRLSVDPSGTYGTITLPSFTSINYAPIYYFHDTTSLTKPWRITKNTSDDFLDGNSGVTITGDYFECDGSGNLYMLVGDAVFDRWIIYLVESPAASGTLTGSGVDDRIATWSGTNSIDSDSSLTWDGSEIGIEGEVKAKSFNIQSNFGAKSSAHGSYINIIGEDSSAQANYRGISIRGQVRGTNTGEGVGAISINGIVAPTSATGTVYGGIELNALDYADTTVSYNVTNFYNKFLRSDNNGSRYSGTVTNLATLCVADPPPGWDTAGATITNNRGIHIHDQTRGINNWAIYSEGTAPSSFGGDVEMRGSTSGSITIAAPAAAGSSTITWPASTGTVALTSDLITTLSGLTDTNFSSLSDWDVVRWDSIAGEFINSSPSTIASQINFSDLADIDTATTNNTPTFGGKLILKYNINNNTWETSNLAMTLNYTEYYQIQNTDSIRFVPDGATPESVKAHVYYRARYRNVGEAFTYDSNNNGTYFLYEPTGGANELITLPEVAGSSFTFVLASGAGGWVRHFDISGSSANFYYANANYASQGTTFTMDQEGMYRIIYSTLDTTGFYVWYTPMSGSGGSGNVTKVGTPANNQIGVWTGDGTIEGDSNFLWNGSQMTITGNLSVSGTVQMVGYGSGNNTGTKAKYAAWDSSGNLIEEDLPAENGYTYWHVIGERNGTTGAGSTFAYGNGSSGNNEMTVGVECELYSLSIHTQLTSSATIQVLLNGTTQIATVSLSSQTQNTAVLTTPHSLSATDTIQLKIASGTCSGVSVASAVLRKPVAIGTDGKAGLPIYVIDSSIDVSSASTGDDKGRTIIPSNISGNLTGVGISFTSAGSGTSGALTVQLTRIRAGVAVDMLSTRITIDADELNDSTAASSYVINTANDDLQPYDMVRVDIDTGPSGGTPPKGLMAFLEISK